VERLHPITGEEEVSVDVKVARVVLADLGAESLHDLGSVEVLADPVKLIVAKTVAAALLGDVVRVAASLLVRTNHGVVAVDGGRNTRPDAFAVVTALNQAQAAGQGIVHSLALLRVKDSRRTTLTASHGTVLGVLGQTIGKTVTNEDGLKVDVALLVREDLGGEDWDVVASVRLARDVERLSGVLGELLEEESQESVDVLAGSNSVGDRAATV
jgi:hypothetical protein